METVLSINKNLMMKNLEGSCLIAERPSYDKIKLYGGSLQLTFIVGYKIHKLVNVAIGAWAQKFHKKAPDAIRKADAEIGRERIALHAARQKRVGEDNFRWKGVIDEYIRVTDPNILYSKLDRPTRPPPLVRLWLAINYVMSLQKPNGITLVCLELCWLAAWMNRYVKMIFNLEF